MAKLDIVQLHRAIGREEFDHVMLTSALNQYAAVYSKINELLKSGAIIRVKKGLYVFGPNIRQEPICREVLANLIYGPSYISLEYALSFHGLIPERVETITSVTPKKNRQFDTPMGRFTYRHLALKQYPHGIALNWIDKNHPTLIATPEKALCDYVILNNICLETSRAAKDFLESDLRINETARNKFDIKQLFKLNKFYKNSSLTNLLEAF